MDDTVSIHTARSTVNLVLRRLAAYWIDCSLSFLVVVLVNLALAPVNPLIKLLQGGQVPADWQYHLWVIASASVPIWAYFTLTQAARPRATPGMRVLKLRVVTLEGARLPVARSLLRTAILLIPFELNHILVAYVYPNLQPGQEGLMWALLAFITGLCGLYVGMCFLTPRQQSLHDLAAGTVVIPAASA